MLPKSSTKRDTRNSYGFKMYPSKDFSFIEKEEEKKEEIQDIDYVNEELDKLNQIQVKQLKNRYSDPNRNKRFMVGIDRAKMKLYDVESSAQADIIDSGQGDMVDYSSKFKKNYGTLKV
jgi:hypothetical protein